jgi:hypothetical protein
MARVIEHAVDLAEGVRAASAFDAWLAVHDAQAAWGQAEGLPPLLTQFGTSLVERALIEAVCRAAGRPFHELLRSDPFGMRLGDIHPTPAGQRLPAMLADFPLPLNPIVVRHTVGLADPLTDAEIPPAERLDDGLPQSLEASIRTYGLHEFKIKVCGVVERDRERLRRIAEVLHAALITPRLEALARMSGPDAKLLESMLGIGFGVTLDGNEQFRDLGEFRAFWEELKHDEELRSLVQALQFVEQPLHRSVALDPAVARLEDWTDRPPIIIDESDAELNSLPRALTLGYAGSSHKNCKGIFKSVANLCLLRHLARNHAKQRFVLSGEDLANIGPVALLQDLAVNAALFLQGVERNGHHYFAGLSMFPTEVQRQVLAAHGDLYHPSRDGWPTLAIRNGSIALQSVNAAPFGVGFDLDVEQFTPLADWRRAHSS